MTLRVVAFCVAQARLAKALGSRPLGMPTLIVGMVSCLTSS